MSTSFKLPFDLSADRVPGLSGVLRLRDEETWCCLAIESFLPWLDELVIVVQPSMDRTRDLVERYRGGKVAIYDYPFLTVPNGPGHDREPAESVHSSAYYYNWSLSRSTRTHVVKLDGDMVMMDWAGDAIRSAMGAHDRIKFHGIDIVGEGLSHVGNHPRCPTDGVYRVTSSTRYMPGPLSEKLVGAPDSTCVIEVPAFVHLKWSKPVESATKAWPRDWANMPHFQRIWKRRVPVARYDGEYPASIKQLL